MRTSHTALPRYKGKGQCSLALRPEEGIKVWWASMTLLKCHFLSEQVLDILQELKNFVEQVNK